MTETMADLSVIIPAYQAEATIERALSSIAGQTLKPAEVIVVDDGSRDQTAKVAKGFLDKMGEIKLKVLTQENAGAGAARNNAISHASKTYIAFLDADDEWFPEKIEQSLTYLQESSALLIGHNGWIDKNGSETYIDIATRFKAAAEAPFHGLYRRGFISTSSVVTSRQKVLDVGGFDTSLRVGHDFDLWLKLLALPNAKFEVFDLALTKYHISANSITSQTQQRLINTLEIALRHAPTLKLFPGSPLASLWFRIFAVHREALTAYAAASKPAAYLTTVFKLPFNTLLLTTKFLLTRKRP